MSVVKKISNRLLMAVSGRRLRAYSVLVHVGRSSGRVYRNPVSAYPLGDGFVVPVPLRDRAHHPAGEQVALDGEL